MPRLRTRLRRILGEIGYVQRRTFELRTGVALTGPGGRSARSRRVIRELDDLWGL